MSQLIPPDADLVSAYWAEKSHDLGLENLDTSDAWAFGGTADQADELLGLGDRVISATVDHTVRLLAELLSHPSR